MRQPLHITVFLIAVGVLVGVGAGILCARQDEAAKDPDAIESQQQRRDESKTEPAKDGKPWLRINGSPPTRLHYSLFFGAWGGIIGVLLAAGGKWSVAIPAGIFGGLLGLFIERAANGLMFERGFVVPHDPKAALIFAIAFLSATAAAHLTSFREKGERKKRLPAPN